MLKLSALVFALWFPPEYRVDPFAGPITIETFWYETANGLTNATCIPGSEVVYTEDNRAELWCHHYYYGSYVICKDLESISFNRDQDNRLQYHNNYLAICIEEISEDSFED